VQKNTQITEYTVARNLVGATNVKYRCPGCGVKLSDPLEKAGQNGNCPECQAVFLIPGEKELARQQSTAEAEKRKKEEAEAEKKQAESLKKNLASVQPPSLPPQPDGAGLDPLFDMPALPPPLLDNHVAPVPVQSIPDYRRPQQFKARRNPQSETDKRKWWKDSIQLHDIRKSRYPALMAYRNLMVIIWWIFSFLVIVAIFATPFYFGSMPVTEYRSKTDSLNAEIAALRNLAAPVSKALEAAKNGRGLSYSDEQELSSALNSINYSKQTFFYGSQDNGLTSSEVAEFASSFIRWRDEKLKALADRKPNLFAVMAKLLGWTIAGWALLLITGILYTILLLVPPECIQLAIDVESGIRSINIGNQRAQPMFTEQNF